MARSTALSLRAVLAFAAGVYSQSCIGTDGAKVYEAEDGVLSGTTVDTAQAGFTGEHQKPHSLLHQSDFDLHRHRIRD